MRIAVGFFGIPRNSGICYPSIQKHVVGALPAEAEVTCFYHFYQQDAVVNQRSGESHALNVSDYSPFVDTMTGILEKPGDCLDRWDFHTFTKYGDAWDDGCSSLSNLVHQLNSLHRVTGLIQTSEPDFAIFARPDLYYHRPLPQYPFSQLNEWQRTVHVPPGSDGTASTTDLRSAGQIRSGLMDSASKRQGISAKRETNCMANDC